MITVTGVGRVRAAPDVVRVRVTATALRPTVADAVSAVEATVAAIRRALAQHGVTGADAASGAFVVLAEQDWTGERGPRISGFRCDHELRVTLRDLTGLGPVLGAVVAAGGDGVRLDGVEPGVSDPGPLRTRARELAWADAVERGRQLAALAGRELAGAVRIVEDGADAAIPGPFADGAPHVRTVAEVAVRPGDVEVTVSLAVQWEFS